MPTNPRKSPVRYNLTRRGQTVRDLVLLMMTYGVCVGIGIGLGSQLFN